MEWVSEVTVGKASYKAVLTALAWFHHEKRDECKRSIPAIVRFTELNKKTVLTAIEWLESAGLITVEKRLGGNNHYRLHFSVTSPKNGTARRRDTSSNFGPGGQSQTSPKNGTSTEIGPVPKTESDQYQKRTKPVPKLELSRVGEKNRDIPPIVPHDEKSVANRVIESLNHHAGKNYRLTDNNRKPIIARLRDGFTEGDCVQVITNRVSRWQGTELAQYLRPDTLFRPSKFESYLNDAGETGTSSSDPVYDPGETERLLRETFPDDDPGLKALPGGPRWKH